MLNEKLTVRAFVNKNKTDGDNKPDFTNKDKRQNIEVAVWRNEDGSLNIQVKPLEQQ